MSLGHEWTEWHLTPNGWVSGSTRTDIARIKEVPPPNDRVLTCKWIEIQSSPSSEMERYEDKVWESDDKEIVSELKRQFGECPHSL